MSEAKDILVRLKDQGRCIIGCFPLYLPLELLHSFGLTPIVLWGARFRETSLSLSDRHLQNYTCRLARNLTEFILSSGSSLLDALFMYNACDTLRNLPEIIEAGLDERGSRMRIFRLHVPAVPEDRTMARAYLSGRIKELVSELEGFTRRPFSEQDFLRSTEQYHKQRALCNECADLCSRGKVSFAAGADLLELAHILPVEEHISLLQQTLEQAHGTAENNPAPIRIMASGIQAPPAELLTFVEASGLRIVDNDIATLSRSYGYNPVPREDPGEYYCDFYFNHHPCTTMLPAGDQRVELIRHAAASAGIEGFIFFEKSSASTSTSSSPISGTCSRPKVSTPCFWSSGRTTCQTSCPTRRA
jgi:benzoyl-CoA reductase/2-hydroxyglutaryl-CoA dehydratase subunit BcrC/BadD/HgdB